MSDLPFQSILFDAARPGRPVFLRHGSWPRGRWVAFRRGTGRGLVLVVGRKVRHPAPEQWRSDPAHHTEKPGS